MNILEIPESVHLETIRRAAAEEQTCYVAYRAGVGHFTLTRDELVPDDVPGIVAVCDPSGEFRAMEYGDLQILLFEVCWE